MFWELSIHGNPYVKIAGVCDSFGLGLDTRMTNGFYVQPQGSGGARVKMLNFQLFDSTALGKGGPGWDENYVNNSLKNDLPTTVENTINQSFAIPQIAGWALFPRPLSKDHIDLLPTCTKSSDCSANAGPEDGCFFPTQDNPLSPQVVAWDTNKQLADSHTGVCINRLQPKRVNITPRGVDIVLAESTFDPLYRTINTVSSGGGALQCVKPPAPVNPATQLEYHTLDSELYQKHVE